MLIKGGLFRDSKKIKNFVISGRRPAQISRKSGALNSTRLIIINAYRGVSCVDKLESYLKVRLPEPCADESGLCLTINALPYVVLKSVAFEDIVVTPAWTFVFGKRGFPPFLQTMD